ncbi:MAG: FAD-dependent oxidoreductase [Armatimonadota bacterium]
MPKLSIDGQPVEVEEGATILEAARKLGINIPTLCYRDGYEPPTSCMVCVVRVNGSEQLVPSCATQATEDMEVESETEHVREARRMALELLLGDHTGDCIAPCQIACPAHLDIPGMIRLIQSGRMDEAVALVKERIALPATLGRICPELCEKACRRGQVDAPVSIQLLNRFVGDYDRQSESRYTPECEPPTDQHVAVIGAGPAGLSAAYYLLQKGHCCTLFDDHDQPGGMLRYGVSDADLPPDILDADIQPILQMGTEFRGGIQVGADVMMDEIREEFDAVLVAAGELSDTEAAALDLPTSNRGLEADRGTQMAPADGVFVAGSALSPSQHAVRAVGSGRIAAEAIHQHLAAQEITVRHRPYTVTMRRLDDEELAHYAKNASGDDRTSPGGGEKVGFSTDEARREARRCLHCECAGLDKCRLRQWAMEYDADIRRFRGERAKYRRDDTHPLVVYEPGKCIKCGLCVQIARREQESLGLTFIGRGFNVEIGTPFDAPLREAFGDIVVECAEACPTGALVLREKTADGDTDTFEPVAPQKVNTDEIPANDVCND